jgi:hypothetical protein
MPIGTKKIDMSLELGNIKKTTTNNIDKLDKELKRRIDVPDKN